MELFLQRCFDGMFNGAIYASLAIALVMIFRSTGLLNFAQGEMGMTGGYLTLVLVSSEGVAGTGLAAALPGHPWPVSVAIVAAVCVGFALGALIDLALIRPTEGRSVLTQVNLTIGLLIFLNGLTFHIWGSQMRRLPSPFPTEADDYLALGGARLRFSTLGVWLTLALVMASLAALLRHTRIGLAFRAITSNRESAALVGINVRRTLMVGWGIASGIGAMAAALVGGALLLEPLTMMKMLIYALAAATVGGLDSPKGALVGGLVIGLAQALIPGYLGVPTELTLLPPLLAMVVVLLVRPQGLFGTLPVERM